jgi:hypothetical protein
MSNFETAKLIASVINRTDPLPVMRMLHFAEDRIQGSSDRMTFDGPWPRDGNPVNLPADKFVAALKRMPEGKFTSKDGNLIIKSGKMSAKMPISTQNYPTTLKPEGFDPCSDSMLEPINLLRPFIAKENPRLWARSVLWWDGYFYATNNVTMVRTPFALPWTDHPITIPDFAIEVIRRAGIPITAIHDRENAGAIEFGEFWLEFRKYSEPWPLKTIAGLFSRDDWDDLPAFDGPTAAQHVEDLLPFAPETQRAPSVCFKPDLITTLDGESRAQVEFDVPCDKEVYFYGEAIADILKHVSAIDFNCYPKPVPFTGEKIQGITMGVYSHTGNA